MAKRKQKSYQGIARPYDNLLRRGQEMVINVGSDPAGGNPIENGGSVNGAGTTSPTGGGSVPGVIFVFFLP